MEKNNSNKRVRWWLYLAVVLVMLFILVWIAIRNWSAVGSTLATPMRRIIGGERVAQLETALFDVQDRITSLKYRFGLSQAENPFQDNTLIEPEPEVTEAAVVAESTPTISLPTPTPESASQAEDPQGEIKVAAPGEEIPEPAPTPMMDSWKLADITPFAGLTGEGIWEPYFESLQGDVVSYRTFLQPDPERPYALVAVAAFDLTKTNLHFVLGYEEPAKEGGPRGYGAIAPDDFKPGKLLAAFNGGFIAEHGGYGAMADGVTALAGRAGLATIGLFKDGSVRIGEWKVDLPQDGDYQAWRQNALMIIHNGEINPKVETGTYIEWGANLDGAVVTMRSAIGLDEENEVLYYFAGPKLSMPVLANAMVAAGVHNGMLLDINPTHAHFTAMRVEDGEFVPEPLYPEEMSVWVDRYLRPWKQDFFYITAKE